MSISFAKMRGKQLRQFNTSKVEDNRLNEEVLNEESAKRLNSTYKYKRNNKTKTRLQENSVNLRNSLRETLLDIIQEACPVQDILEADRDYLREAVEEVLLLQNGNIRADDNTIDVHVNSGGANPDSAQNMINRCAKLRIGGIDNGLKLDSESDEFGNMVAYNNIDTISGLGADETTANNGCDEFTDKSLAINGAYRKLIGTVSEKVRQRVMNNYRSEINRIQDSKLVTESDIDFGLSEGMKSINKKKRALKEDNNPVREIFSSIRLLSENATNLTPENLLNETIFHMTVVETYNAYGLLESTGDSFIMNLRNNTRGKLNSPV